MEKCKPKKIEREEDGDNDNNLDAYEGVTLFVIMIDYLTVTY